MTRLSDKDRALFTQSEWELLRASSLVRLKSLKKARVKLQLKRARKLAVKYRDLTRDRRRSAKKEPRYKKEHSIADRRAMRKSQLATEASRRFEKRLAQLEKTPAVRTQTQKGTNASGKQQGMTVQQEAVRKAKQRLRAIGRTAPAQKTTRRFQRKRTKAIQGHIRARGQRHQAKRDSK
jgi:hypothetical protein